MNILLPLLYTLGFGLLGYLCGSLPFAVWVTRLFKGVDVREAGSGHATTTNTIRQAGFGPGALVLVLDIAKGYLPVWLALHVGRDTTSWYFGIPPYTWLAPLTAALVVVGHCWPVFAQFRGGMGNASAGGAILAANPLAFVIGLGILVALVLILRHSARASVLTGLLIAPAFWLLGLGNSAIWIAASTGLVIAYRFLIDWNRQYRELWLDREQPPN
ncbi:MAG: glycerol-3-phosphate acyltransferase [Anaerolineales bacterium]|nr:glycerol-3-phosphate acyltransferase [Anaerolineales bacterium]